MKIKLTEEEVSAEKLSVLLQLKVFLFTIVAIPVSLCSVLFFTCIEIIKIPMRTLKIITISEQIKQLIKRKTK